MLTLEQQKQIIQLYKLYNSTDKNIIKANFKKHIEQLNIRPVEISNKTGIPKQTIYALTKQTSNYKPDFMISLIVSIFLKISIIDLLQPIPRIDITDHQPEINTKWTITAKQEFINDYNRLDIAELCNKYNIAPRTAEEYNRNFTRDIENI